MSYLTVRDGTKIYFKDWGSGQPIVFSHGWPLSSDAWDNQMLYFGKRGYRVVAHDRRGHGRSGGTWSGNDMDTYADDLDELFESLDLSDAVLVGHSTGGGEVARYIGRHGTGRLDRAVLLGAVPPVMLKSGTNPGGLPIEAFDQLRKGVAENRSQFFRDLAMPFYGYNRPGAKVSQGIIDSFWQQSMWCSIIAAYDCIEAFSETDFTDDLKEFNIPTLVAQGRDDQIVPFDDSGKLSSKLIKGAQLKVYDGAPHGLAQTLSDQFNSDLLAFVQEGAKKVKEAPRPAVH